jgi:hypothetical protein
MVSQSWKRSWSFDYYECRPYREIKWNRGEEPRKRSLHLIARSAQSQWHVTVTFQGSLHPDRIARIDLQRRRQYLQCLCLCLDFDRFQLLDNTVTELVIRCEHDETPPVYANDVTLPTRLLPLKSKPLPASEYFLVLDQLRFCVREDPRRVHFPVLHCNQYTTTRDFSDVRKVRAAQRRRTRSVHE